MAARRAVKIFSGRVEATDPVQDVPKDEWPNLVFERKAFIAREINHDCRCLIRFVQDAEVMWGDLNYASADDLIARGYELEPEEIRLAVRWLELNEPESVIGLEKVKELTRQEQAQRLAQSEEPVLTHGGKRDGAGRKPADADENQDDNSAKHNLDSRCGTGASYRVRRLKRDHPAIADRLARGEFKSVAAAERASRGEEPHPKRKEPTAIDQLRRFWSKATAAEREAFLAEVQS